MKYRVLIIAWLLSIVIAIGLSWYITTINTKPEKVIVTQEKIIYQLKANEAARYIFKIPFTEIGLTVDHLEGFVAGIIAVHL
jgi:membrane protein CcdC involved in cytochrome C biogenesis